MNKKIKEIRKNVRNDGGITKDLRTISDKVKISE